ncbi:N-6 DNA methylase [Streptomyces sp. NBC_00249]|uniref:N-6 DNA methylase n=1 Tax=Streptomyces sp. NBC_00249 TaxID=2975690 RepID=UPI0022539162|nr:N-6 DNA methylase [Streptomyces sp. NBC_00249]MCX5193418.1 N-6 DNA methylase [Streptomyces sp. NBC_00249]
MPSAQDAPVTLAEIARIAGVGRAAVSNWRRRHDSFPVRIGGTDASPHFSLAEVEEWLRANDKLKEGGGRELLWPRLEAAGPRDETGLAIAAAGRRMSGRTDRAREHGLSPQALELVDEAALLGATEGAKEVFDFLLQRWLDTHVRQISATPPQLASLIAETALHGVNRFDEPLTVLDPACGTGHLLAAAADAAPGQAVLAGCDRDPVLAALAQARLSFPAGRTGLGPVDVRSGDSLLDDPHSGLRADVVVCNPPFNERDWGYEDLATDPRWAHGLPPRTEPELAWVQHALARLRPGGTAVLLLPPAVASRRAGRRIRGALLRSAQLRAVIALPAGTAPPHSVSLHLWVLKAEAGPVGDPVLLVDATSARRSAAGKEAGPPDWERLRDLVGTACATIGDPDAELPEHAARVALIDLLDEEVDLTPGRYVTSGCPADPLDLDVSWTEFDRLVRSLAASGRALRGLALAGEADRDGATSVGDLARAGALTLRGGQQPREGSVLKDAPDAGAVAFLTVPDLLLDGTPSAWLDRADAPVVAEPGDIVVAGVDRAFQVWIQQHEPLALGPQLYALRATPDLLDADFLAGCLRAPANKRQAGTHASSSSRVDVRRLHVLQLPLEDQRRYSAAFRKVQDLRSLLGRVEDLGSGLVRDLSDSLASGRLAAEC